RPNPPRPRRLPGPAAPPDDRNNRQRRPAALWGNFADYDACPPGGYNRYHPTTLSPGPVRHRYSRHLDHTLFGRPRCPAELSDPWGRNEPEAMDPSQRPAHGRRLGRGAERGA